MSERASLSTHHRELMLSLAYLGGLTYALALRLLPCYSERTLQRDLTDLRQLGDVEKHAIYKAGPKGRPVKQYDVWTLTDKGHAYIAAKANDQYPIKPTKLRNKRVMAHDLLVMKAIVALVERARQEGLSGLFVQCETRLNPDERRPIPDAVVIMQFGGGFGRPDIVPWTKDPAIEDETRSRFVIEADFQTETLSVIAGKARAYRASFENPEWRTWWAAQFGPQPIIMWVVADKEDDPRPAGLRLSSIFGVWSPIWPNGYWLGTTERCMEKRDWAVHTAEQCDWFKLTTLQTERRADTVHILPVPERSVSQPAARTVATAPRTVDASRAEVIVPGTTVGHVTAARQALAIEHSAQAAPTTGTEHDRWRAASQPPSRAFVDERPVTGITPVNHYNPVARVATTPAYIPSTPRALEPRDIAWIVMLVVDYASEARYIVRRLLEVFGIVWFVRTCARLITWFFWEEGYRIVGALVGIVVCLGVLGWIGHRVYSTYRAQPLFPLHRPTPNPASAAAVPPVATTSPQPTSLPLPLAQPPVPLTCGTARVITEGLNLRETPGGPVLSVLYQNDEVVLLCAVQRVGATEWVRVRAGRHTGWVSKRYLGLSGS